MGSSFQPAKEHHGTREWLIKAFKRVFDMSCLDSFGKLTNIRMKEGQ